MASTSYTPSREISYDVFLSFRGIDTRKTFVDHLYNKLVETGIRTFKDDEELEKGQPIGKLLPIIKESRFAIVVFSKNYASAKWCLEEIATIMECQEQYGEKNVIPIFYDVDPTVVRNQTESFAESFKKHKENNIEKAEMERWRKALKKAAQIAGYHLQNDFNGYEAKCFENVIKQIFTLLNQSIPASTVLENNFVGLGSRVGDVGTLLRQEPNEVQFIGIWGMGGIGKTVIAMAVLKKFSSQFAGGACYVPDISANHVNIIELQKTLLKTILKIEKIAISTKFDGMEKIERWLGEKKVLIILDDVDQVEQLEMLAGGRNWFGRGSRIIITTRNKKVLVSHKVDEKYIYEVHKLVEQEALQLFCWYAFGRKIPENGFEEQCGSIVRYAMGLPLALKHLGSHLCGENADNWKSILVKLKDIDSLHTPKDKIAGVLRISFDGLDPDNKNVFLHIACFFRNWKEGYVKEVLDNDMRVLIDKSLISVQNGRIEMHDLIQEMGWHIARKEEPRRRVWQFKEVCDVLCRYVDHHHHIEGISCWEWLHKNIISRTFKITLRRMRKLKMLKAVGGDDDNVFRVKDNYLPSSLRWLEYEFYHFPSLPQRFESSELVGLSLRKSSLLNCNFTKKLIKLTILDLSSSLYLLGTPDFDKMPNLMKLNLSYCKNLKEIHPSIGNLRNLVFLNLSACSNLKELPSFNQVSPLETLYLDFCEKLERFPEIKAETPHLVNLDLREVGIKEVSSSIQQLYALTKLSLEGCEHLECLPNDLCKLKSLKILKIKDCRNLKSLPENLEGLISLEYLNLQRSHFDSLPESFSQLISLQYLDITDCQNPNELPKLPANIRELYADCRFKIAKLAIKCSKLYSVSYTYDDNHEVGTFLSKEFIHFQLHRETPLCVSYLITAEDNISRMNQMLRSFKYRHYKSNGISIHLNSPWYSQNFVGFVVCFLRSDGDIWGPHSYQDIDHSMKHCKIIAKLSHKDSENGVLQKNCVIAGLAGENDVDDARGHICFAFIPFRSLCPKSKAIKDYSRFEVRFMNSKASADWGCSLLYERPTEASEHISKHDGSDSGLTTDDIACLTLLELERTEYLNLNRLNSAHILENYNQLPHLRYVDISDCRRLIMLPKLPPTIRALYAYSNLASESNIAKLAEYSELYSVSFSCESNIAKLNLSAEKLARKFVHLPSQIRNSPFLVTYPTLTDIDTKRWFKHPSHRSNKVSINLNPSWYSETFVGFVVHFLLKGRLHRWESHPNIRPFRHCKVIAKLIHKDNANEVLQTNCVISRLYDEEFDFEEFMICFAYIPFCSLSSVISPNDYSVFEVAFLDSNNSSDWSCGLLYKNDESLSEAIWSGASSSYNDSEPHLFTRSGPQKSKNRSWVEHRDEETSMTEHSIEEASMAFTQPEAIIGESIQRIHNHPIVEDCEIQQEPGLDIIKSGEWTEIVDPIQCRMVSMPESSDKKVVRLLYTNSGVGILALSSDGTQKLWKWSLSDEQNTSVKATANSIPQHWQPNSGLLMINDVSGVNLDKVVPCIDLNKNDFHVASAAGGMVSLFDINTFKVLTTFRPSTPTFLVFDPHNNDIVAIGTEDSTIYIYDVRVDEVKAELIKGHQKHITGLAFSIDSNMLVSSGADGQLCMWNIVGRWQKRRSVRIQLPASEVPSGDTHVMFKAETQLAIYDASKMECMRQWIPQGCLSAPISSATYSCNSQKVYASFKDGNIGVLDADALRLICRIAPSAYLCQLISNRSECVYPRVVAAHPDKPNQFAAGMTDGSVKVLEPLESQRNWEVSPHVDNGMTNGRLVWEVLHRTLATMCLGFFEGRH